MFYYKNEGFVNQCFTSTS